MFNTDDFGRLFLTVLILSLNKKVKEPDMRRLELMSQDLHIIMANMR